jgi:hypothetical protein
MVCQFGCGNALFSELNATYLGACPCSKPEEQGTGGICSLTFELRRDQRQDARPGLAKMYRVPSDRAWWPAVGPRLERRVRRHATRDSLGRVDVVQIALTKDTLTFLDGTNCDDLTSCKCGEGSCVYGTANRVAHVYPNSRVTSAGRLPIGAETNERNAPLCSEICNRSCCCEKGR